MNLSSEEIRKIATLARLKLSAAEEARYATTISAVLDYMTILNEVDTTGVEPTSQVTGLTDVTRPDTVVDSGLSAALIKRFPDVKHDQLVVPAVFE